MGPAVGRLGSGQNVYCRLWRISSVKTAFHSFAWRNEQFDRV